MAFFGGDQPGGETVGSTAAAGARAALTAGAASAATATSRLAPANRTSARVIFRMVSSRPFGLGLF